MPLSPSDFCDAAAQWGSFMHDGDPGACMYTFDERGLIRAEAHRRKCLDWIDSHCRTAADINDDPAGDHKMLDDMAAYLRAAPVTP